MKQMRSRIFLVAALLSIVLPASQSSAATAIVRDGSTLQLGNVTYRLDGIDVPTVDQLCIDEHADVLDLRDRGARSTDQIDRRQAGPLRRSRPRSRLQETAHRRLQGRGRDHKSQPVAGPQRLCPECRSLRHRALPAGRGPRQGRPPGIMERLLRRAARVPRRRRRTAPCSAPRAAPTATAKSARPCSRRIS